MIRFSNCHCIKCKNYVIAYYTLVQLRPSKPVVLPAPTVRLYLSMYTMNYRNCRNYNDWQKRPINMRRFQRAAAASVDAQTLTKTVKKVLQRS